jgi:hypothetical protein
MKKAFLFLATILCFHASLLAQGDTAKAVEPGMETSYDNQELLIIALVGLVLLMAMYFFFKRSRRWK